MNVYAMQGRILPRSFYDRPSLTVAKDILGKVLVREHPHYGRMAARIVAAEAYIGPDDKACRGRFGLTEANKTLFGVPGHAYIYLVYGRYSCLNIKTERTGFPADVFIRACEPLEGIEAMKKLRGGRAKNLKSLTSGPGKLCMAMDITPAMDGIDVCVKGALYVEDSKSREKFAVVQTKRVGVEYAGEYANKPWRFYIEGNPFVTHK